MSNDYTTSSFAFTVGVEPEQIWTPETGWTPVDSWPCREPIWSGCKAWK